MKRQFCSAGETIYSPFSDSKQIYRIQKGYVFAYTINPDGKRRIHLIYGPDSFFPVITAFKNREQRAAYEALCDTVVDKMKIADFKNRVNSDHEFTLEILHKTIDQLEIFANRLVELQTTNLEDKLYFRLKVLAQEHGSISNMGMELPYVLKHHHLADMFGVERESLSRAYHKLEQKNKVIKKSGKIIVL